jgi:hypothetical protein
MDQSVRYLTQIGFWFLIFISFRCGGEPHLNNQNNTYTITITKLDEHQVFKIPNFCNGWQRRSSYIVENTANDSIRIRDKIFAPGQVGKIYSMDVFEEQSIIEYHYWPYKATTGRIVIKILVSDCDKE